MSDFRILDAAAGCLLGRSASELRAIAAQLGQPAYRGEQLTDWLYRQNATSVDAMANLPKGFRAALAERFRVGRGEVVARREAVDHTTKLLLDFDGDRVETVLLPYEDRTAVCVSSQVGCAAGCTFCATATMGFVRNLRPGEIVGQVLAATDALNAASWYPSLSEGARSINHVVFMGMGEPLWNLDNVVKAIHILNKEVGIGMRGITVSTVGIPDGIRALADHNLQITLAVSLHAGTDETRRAIVPVGTKYPFNKVLDAAWYYFEVTGRRVTYEYVLLGGVNDTRAEAEALADRLYGTPSHVNIIPWNPATTREEFRRPAPDHVRRFRAVLEDAGVEVTQRRARGRGIDAACGQLAGTPPEAKDGPGIPSSLPAES